MIQGSPEWFEVRRGMLTASRFGDLMARTKSGPSTSRTNLITLLACERFTGQSFDGYQNDAMRRGTEMEPIARKAYEDDRLCAVDPAFFQRHPVYGFAGCSPDGYIGEDGLLEIKCPAAPAKHLEALKRGSHATEYKWQLQGQLWVTGRKWVDAVSYDPRFGPRALAIVRVLPDAEAIEALQAECLRANEEIEQQVAWLRGEVK